MRLLIQIMPKCFDEFREAESAQISGFIKWITKDCFLCQPRVGDMPYWKKFLNHSPKDIQDLFINSIKWCAVNIREEDLLPCGHWPGIDLVLTAKVAHSGESCSCGAELVKWLDWIDSNSLDRLRDLRARPMLKGESRDKELGDRMINFLRFCKTITIIDRYLTNAVGGSSARPEKIPGIGFFKAHKPLNLEYLEIICADHGQSKYNVLHNALESDRFFAPINICIYRVSKRMFQEQAHHRLIGFTINSRIHTVSIDKGFASLVNDPLISDIPTQYLSPNNGVARTKDALKLNNSQRIYITAH